MRLPHLLTALTAASAATLGYGMLVEANRLVVERLTLRLRRWPTRLDGYRIGFLADFHVRGPRSLELGERAVAAALDEAPDMIVLGGDFVGFWEERSASLVGSLLEPLLLMEGKVVAVPGNHEYWFGTPELLRPILDEFGIRLLRNEMWSRDGISWVGVDSMNSLQADPLPPMQQALDQDDPIVVVWHEPDPVEVLPPGAALMLSGHSHGGQFTFPWGWTPMHTKNGEKYVRGYYPHAPTPLYVSRGIGTTGYPARLCCPPEVTILTLTS